MLLKLLTVTPTLDTSAYASGDVLFNATEVNDALDRANDRCILRSIFVLDEDAQAQPFDLIFLQSATNLGAALNAVADITDANAREIIGAVSIASGNWLAASGSTVRMAQLNNINMVLDAGAGLTDLWIAAIARGTPTHTAAGLKIKIGIDQYRY